MALSPEILKKIKRIHLKTNFLTSELFTGEYESAFKGMGMAFEEVREYVPGDDIRMIDWNVTARTGRPHLKIFREERERSLILMVDVSPSMCFGGVKGTKQDLAAELAAVLAYAAVKSNDKVGLLLFSDKIERFIPPKKGRGHVWRLIEEILSFKPVAGGTNLDLAVRHVLHMVKRRSIAIVISDFLERDIENPLRILKGRHDIVALHIVDRLEEKWSSLGLLPVSDLETGGWRWVDSSSKRFKRQYSEAIEGRKSALRRGLRGKGIDVARLSVGDDYVHALMALFLGRERRR